MCVYCLSRCCSSFGVLFVLYLCISWVWQMLIVCELMLSMCLICLLVLLVVSCVVILCLCGVSLIVMWCVVFKFLKVQMLVVSGVVWLSVWFVMWYQNSLLFVCFMILLFEQMLFVIIMCVMCLLICWNLFVDGQSIVYDFLIRLVCVQWKIDVSVLLQFLIMWLCDSMRLSGVRWKVVW